MPSKPELNPKILDYLHQKLGKPISTIRSAISVLKREYPQSTSNAVAQIYAQQHGVSVRRLISKEDKQTIPPIRIEKTEPLRLKRKAKSAEQIKEIIKFETTDYFLQKHIREINRAYTKQCYTCVFVLTRKVLENMIIGILKEKYPTERTLYFDTTKYRNLDFSVVLDNLFQKRSEFDSDKKEAIERLHQKLKPFKNDANDKVHSLYHIVENPNEIDDWNLDTIIALIEKIM
ncbi:MAG: hypothetical protein HY867_05495 [Chloroflexi bacterium]|nr:hypothetical protein [Chloroflexota bacterium]